MREFQYSYFVTLTYSDEKLPPNGSLLKKDLQLFMKRLRSKYPSQSIRYFGVGEYGDQTKRAHYHIIVMTNEDMDLQIARHKNGKAYIEKSAFHRSWLDGCIVDVAIIPSIDNGIRVARYCAGYVVKKLTSKAKIVERIIEDNDGKRLYCDLDWVGKEPEFAVMSRKPGIGLQSLGRLIKAIKRNKVGPNYLEGVEKADGLYMLRYLGKLWPVSRTLRDKLLIELGKDLRVDRTKDIVYDYKAKSLFRKLLDENYKKDFEDAIRESEERAKKAEKKASRYKRL